MTREEQETVITFDRASDEMNVYTADPNLMARLDKLDAYKKWREHRFEGKVIAADYRADKKLLTLRTKKLTRNMTDEQKKAASERMKSIRQNRQKESS